MSVDSSANFAISKKYKNEQVTAHHAEHYYPHPKGYHQGYYPNQYGRRKNRPYHLRTAPKKFKSGKYRYPQEEIESYHAVEEYFHPGNQCETPSYAPQYQGYSGLSLQDSPIASGAPTDYCSPGFPSVRRNDPYAVNVIPIDIEAENMHRQSKMEEARRSYYSVYDNNSLELPADGSHTSQLMEADNCYASELSYHDKIPDASESFAGSAMNPNAIAFQARQIETSHEEVDPRSRSRSCSTEVFCPTEKSKALSPFQEAFIIPEPTRSTKDLQMTSLSDITLVSNERVTEDEMHKISAGKKESDDSYLTGTWVAMVTFRTGAAVPFLIQDAARCFKESRLTRKTAVGVHVIVDGDRGIDLGTMSEVIPITEREPVSAAREYNVNRGKRQRGPKILPLVIRLASCAEIAEFEMLEVDEAAALQYAQQHALKEFGADMLTISAATFQFDRQKLTLYFTAPERIFFVPLLKTLNQKYRCRIWMEHAETERERENIRENKASRKAREQH